MTPTSHRGFDILLRATYLLLALQIGVIIKVSLDFGFDRATETLPLLLMGAALLSGHLRRLSARPPDRGAARWLLASRIAALCLLALGTIAVAYLRFATPASPDGSLVVAAVFSLMWVIIALKGAAMGKLMPGSSVGLRVTWTRQSRLAWDRGHRTLGRVLFWGGLIGLATCLLAHPLVSLAMWGTTVALAVALALLGSWRNWRVDPDRHDGHPAC